MTPDDRAQLHNLLAGCWNQDMPAHESVIIASVIDESRPAYLESTDESVEAKAKFIRAASWRYIPDDDPEAPQRWRRDIVEALEAAEPR